MKYIKKLPEQCVLNQLFSYDKEKGTLTGIAVGPCVIPNNAGRAARNKQCAGKEVGFSINTSGYAVVGVLGGMYLTHRIIWKLVTGEDPKVIDHLNGLRSDNRWCNLRNTTDSINACNKFIRYSNKCKVSGISIVKQPTGIWYRARITLKGRTTNLYYGLDFFEAVCKRKAAESAIGLEKYIHNSSLKLERATGE